MEAFNFENAFIEFSNHMELIHETFIKAFEYYKKNISYDLLELKNEDSESSILTLEDNTFVEHIGYCNVIETEHNGRIYYELVKEDAEKFKMGMLFEKQSLKKCGYHELIWQRTVCCEDDYQGYLLFPMKDEKYWIVKYEC